MPCSPSLTAASDVASAIDFKRGAGDHLGIRGGQENGGASDVLGPVQATPRDRADEAAPPFGLVGALLHPDEARQHRRVGRHRADGDHPNTVRRKLDRERLGQGDDGSLGRVVHGQARPRTDSGRAGRVEDDPATLRLHARNSRATAVEHAPDVDVHDAVEERIGRVFEWREGLRQARVVEQHVDAAEAVDRPLDHGLDLLGAGYVNLERLRLDAGGADLLDRLGRAGGVQVSGQHASPLFGECQRRSAPDAGAGAGNDRDLALQLHDFSASRTSSAWPSTLTFGKTALIVPFLSITKVVRAMPMYSRPINRFCCQTPYWSATAWSGSASKGKVRWYFCWNFLCDLMLSVLTPRISAPCSWNRLRRSLNEHASTVQPGVSSRG